MPAVVHVLSSPDDEEGQVLRSCAPLPLMSVLSDVERGLLYDRVRDEVQALRRNKASST